LINIIDDAHWSGRCQECRRRRNLYDERTGSQNLTSGSQVDWDARDAANSDKRFVICGVCAKGRFTSIPHNLKAQDAWTGYHLKCSGLSRRKRGDETHSSGTIIHWDERDPNDPHWRIAITCHYCKQKSFAPKASINNPTWRGFCSPCIERYGIPLERRTLKGRYTNPHGAIIDYDAPHDTGRAVVYCPNFSICGNAEQKRVDAHNQDKQPFYCAPCGTAAASARLAGAWATAKGNGQKNAESKPAHRPQHDRDQQWLLDAIKKIADRWEDVRTLDKLSRQAKLEQIKQRDIAFHLGITPVRLSIRLSECELEQVFPRARKLYRSLVEFVADRIDQGASSEIILSDLVQRRERPAA
jgi:hypothetical protein